MNISQLKNKLAHLKPGDVFDMPEGMDAGIIIVGVIGTEKEPIVLRGGSVKLPKGTKKACVWMKGCKFVRLEGMGTENGFDGISLKECEGCWVTRCTTKTPTNDGVKLAMGHGNQVLDNDIQAGADQGVDFFHEHNGRCIDNRISVPRGTCGVFAKAGSSFIEVAMNEIDCPHGDGIHFGDPGNPLKMPDGPDAPWALHCKAHNNVVRCGGRPIAMINAVDCTEYDNDLSTTRMVGGQPGPLVVKIDR